MSKSDYTIHPARFLSGRVTVPGDKSISHRALLLGALAQGKTHIHNLSRGGDVASTAACLEALGTRMKRTDDGVVVYGRGKQGLTPPADPLNAGNSGTTMRLLAGILAGQPFTSTITGDGSLCNRPMRRIIDPLARMGAEIKSSEGGRAPLTIVGHALHGANYTSPVPSGQIKSCLLLAGLCANGRTTVTEPARSRNHTERMLPFFGVPVGLDDLTVWVDGPSTLRGTDIRVPGDISSAAFWMVAAAILDGSELTLPGIGLNPTRTGILDMLCRMGADIRIENQKDVSGESRGDITIRGGSLRAVRITETDIPRIIDEIPVLAVAAAHAEGETRITGASELRVKETDRIAAVASNLRAMGVQIDVMDDGLVIPGPQTLRGAHIRSLGDHRNAMPFAVAGLAAEGDTVIEDATCADISDPLFFRQLNGLTRD